MIIYDKDKRILFVPENDDAVILEWNDIYQKGFRDGYKEGYDEAYEDNYQSGYTDGYAEGIVACYVDATSITLDVPSVIVGSGQADVIVEPADADVELVFTSSDPETATIDENGNITVLDDGEVTFCVKDLRTGLEDCKTVDVEKTYFRVIPPDPNMTFEKSGGTKTITIETNSPIPWFIQLRDTQGDYKPDLTVSPLSGTGTQVVEITASDASCSASPYFSLKDGILVGWLSIYMDIRHRNSGYGKQIKQETNLNGTMPEAMLLEEPNRYPASGGTYTLVVKTQYGPESFRTAIFFETMLGTPIYSGSTFDNVALRWSHYFTYIVPGSTEAAQYSGWFVIKYKQSNNPCDEVYYYRDCFHETQNGYAPPYFRAYPEYPLIEKNGSGQALVIDTNMDIPWCIQVYPGAFGSPEWDTFEGNLTADVTAGTGFHVITLSADDVGCHPSTLPAIGIEELDGEGIGAFQYSITVWPNRTTPGDYEQDENIEIIPLQKAWLVGDMISVEVDDENDNPIIRYPASGGTYTLNVSSTYGPDDYGSVWSFGSILGNATYSGYTYDEDYGIWRHKFAYTIPANTGSTITQNSTITYKKDNSPCTTEFTEVFTFVEEQESGATPTTQVRVQDLITEGYANVVAPGGDYKAGTYIEILPSCPYLPDQIINLSDVALNQEEITAGTRNTIVWNQTLPTGWTDQDIVDIYSGQTISFPPRGEEFWDVKSGITSLELTFTGDTYVTSDYPWGSYTSQGIFSPRFRAVSEGEYNSKGWRQTPATVVVNIASTFSSVSQVMFTQMKSTSALTINQQAGTFACHDVTGMFEGDSALVALNITGAFNYGTWRTMHNVFDGCTALTGIPYSTSWTRDHANNTIYPHADGTRGSANAYHMFRGLNSLTYLGPTINMGAMSLSGCTYGGVTQRALTNTFFDCPELTDVRIINLNNNDWNFADSSTFTYIPKMSAASIEYLLNNVEDVTSQGGHSVTFAGTYKDSVSASAIAYAQSKGWNVIWDE